MTPASRPRRRREPRLRPEPRRPPRRRRRPPTRALQSALQDAAQALKDREAAYASNDLVAAAQADERLQKALEAAIAADK